MLKPSRNFSLDTTNEVTQFFYGKLAVGSLLGMKLEWAMTDLKLVHTVGLEQNSIVSSSTHHQVECFVVLGLQNTMPCCIIEGSWAKYFLYYQIFMNFFGTTGQSQLLISPFSCSQGLDSRIQLCVVYCRFLNEIVLKLQICSCRSDEVRDSNSVPTKSSAASQPVQLYFVTSRVMFSNKELKNWQFWTQQQQRRQKRLIGFRATEVRGLERI